MFHLAVFLLLLFKGYGWISGVSHGQWCPGIEETECTRVCECGTDVGIRLSEHILSCAPLCSKDSPAAPGEAPSGLGGQPAVLKATARLHSQPQFLREKPQTLRTLPGSQEMLVLSLDAQRRGTLSEAAQPSDRDEPHFLSVTPKPGPECMQDGATLCE